MTGYGRVDGYHLHVGPSTLPRHPHRRPMTLARALHRAYGLPYAVVYRLDHQGRSIPVVADAGNPDEVIHLPTGRRMRRHEITRLARPTQPSSGVVEFTFDDPWWTPHRRGKLIAAVAAAGFAVTQARDGEAS